MHVGIAGPRSRVLLTSGLEQLAPGEELDAVRNNGLAAVITSRRKSELDDRVNADLDSDEEDASPARQVVLFLGFRFLGFRVRVSGVGF